MQNKNELLLQISGIRPRKKWIINQSNIEWSDMKENILLNFRYLYFILTFIFVNNSYLFNCINDFDWKKKVVS
jgi:hypothetical protein